MSPGTHFLKDGDPDHVELALSKVTAAFGQPVREAQRLWMDSAIVHALLAQREGMQDLARSNRELAASYDAMVDEMRIRRGAQANVA